MRGHFSIALMAGSALMWPMAALGQEVAGAPSTDEAAAASVDIGDTATGQERAELDPTGAAEIVVTGSRRATALMDTPMSVTVLDAETLASAGIGSTRDLERVTPALQMQSYGGWLQPAIRGISSQGASPGDSSNVAVYVDGVYQANQAGQLFDLPDVSRIEVLKGPQGSLYGQNAAGGAVIVETARPSRDLTGRFQASYGNYDDIVLGGFVSGPLSSTLSASVSGAFQDHEGYRRNIATGGRDFGLESHVLRAKLRFEPSDGISLEAAAFYARRKDSGSFAGVALNGNSIGYLVQPGLPVPDPERHETAVDEVFSRFETWQASLRGEFDLGPGTLNTVTAFNRVEIQQRADADYSQVNVALTTPDPAQSTFVQEINYVAEQSGPFSWIAGLFYLNSEDAYQGGGEFTAYADYSVLPAPPGTAAVVAPFNGLLRKESAAAYLELNYDILDNLTLTAGGRYSYERQRAFAAFTFDGTRPPPSEFPDGPQSWSKFTPRVSLVYRPDAATSVYATYSRGFKSGLINILDFSGPAVDPENVTGYELGFRARPFRSSFFELSLYRYDYRDLQVSSYVAPNYIYENAAAARINGAELTFQASPVRNLDLGAGLSYMDAEYRRYNGQPVVLTSFVPNAAGAGSDQIALDVTGNRLIRAPEWVANLSLRYRMPTQIGDFELFGSLYYNGGFPLEPSARVSQDEYATVDAEFSFRPAGADNLRISLWGRNLTDAEYIQSSLITVFTDGVSFAAPRTYGLRIGYSF